MLSFRSFILKLKDQSYIQETCYNPYRLQFVIIVADFSFGHSVISLFVHRIHNHPATISPMGNP